MVDLVGSVGFEKGLESDYILFASYHEGIVVVPALHDPKLFLRALGGTVQSSGHIRGYERIKVSRDEHNRASNFFYLGQVIPIQL
jgi:hypothetical protein